MPITQITPKIVPALSEDEWVSMSRPKIIAMTTDEYMDVIRENGAFDENSPGSPDDIADGLLQSCSWAVSHHNAYVAKQKKELEEYRNNNPSAPMKVEDLVTYKPFVELEPFQVVRCMIERYHACAIDMLNSDGSGGDSGGWALGVYNDGTIEGEEATVGTYIVDYAKLYKIARRFDPVLKSNVFEHDVIAILKATAPLRKRCADPDLCIVGNGLFDYKNKILLPYDPEYVFLSKTHVNYVPTPANPHITMPDGVDWDVESWLLDLMGSDAMANLMWQTLGATVRPSVPWHRAVFLYSESGNNGKGTFCVPVKCLSGSYESIKINDFDKDFRLTSLMHTSVVVNDENPVNMFLDDVANFKAAVTGDSIQVNRKFKDPVTMTFNGCIIQCINGMPKTRDKSESFVRRLLIIPFERRFEGHERKYIRDDYLRRQDVLEYMLWKVLVGMPDYYELKATDECLSLLDEFRVRNDTVLEFYRSGEWQSNEPVTPVACVYEGYKNFMRNNHESGMRNVMSQGEFMRKFEEVSQQDGGDWFVPRRLKTDSRTGRTRMAIDDQTLSVWCPHTWLRLYDRGVAPANARRPVFAFRPFWDWCHGSNPAGENTCTRELADDGRLEAVLKDVGFPSMDEDN